MTKLITEIFGAFMVGAKRNDPEKDSLSTDGNNIFSYRDKILKPGEKDGVFLLAIKTGSSTSTKHRNGIRKKIVESKLFTHTGNVGANKPEFEVYEFSDQVK